MYSYLSAYEDGTDSVPKRRHIEFRRRGITQKKACNIMAVVMLQLRISPYVNCLPPVLKVAQWFRTLFTPVNPSKMQKESVFSSKFTLFQVPTLSLTNTHSYTVFQKSFSLVTIRQ